MINTQDLADKFLHEYFDKQQLAVNNTPGQARQSVDYNYQQLDWQFINAMARIGHYGGQKYGVGSWKVKTLTGDADPINHAFEHIKAFIQNEGHDKFEDNRMNLAAAAYNLMMAFFYAKPLDIPK